MTQRTKGLTPPPPGPALVRRALVAAALGVSGCGDDGKTSAGGTTDIAPMPGPTTDASSGDTSAGTTEISPMPPPTTDEPPMPNPTDATTDVPPMPNPTDATTDVPPMPPPDTDGATDGATDGDTGGTTAIPPMPPPITDPVDAPEGGL